MVGMKNAHGNDLSLKGVCQQNKNRLQDSILSTAESLLSLKSVMKPLQIGAF